MTLFNLYENHHKWPREFPYGHSGFLLQIILGFFSILYGKTLQFSHHGFKPCPSRKFPWNLITFFKKEGWHIGRLETTENL